MTDYKEMRKCGEPKKLTLLDYFTTFLTVAAVLLLFALATWELGRTGGALDHALGVTVQEMQGAKK